MDHHFTRLISRHLIKAEVTVLSFLRAFVFKGYLCSAVNDARYFRSLAGVKSASVNEKQCEVIVHSSLFCRATVGMNSLWFISRCCMAKLNQHLTDVQLWKSRMAVSYWVRMCECVCVFLIYCFICFVGPQSHI